MPDPSRCGPAVKRLFHGSRFIIEHPEYGKGKPYNDYGQGFYCTESAEMAKEWAVGENCDGYANCYQFDCSGLDILNLNDRSYCLLNWLAVLLDNRTLRVGSSIAFEAKEYVCDAFRVDYKDRDAAARREYLDLEHNRRKRGDLYIAQIIDEEMTADDPRLHQHG